ncbi:response regulator [uncultured Propionibacterium sp.]|uniref:response regulator n=1 Tax=uncultured Propionibacterium sp. TaxID=218066 RepID=UPI00292E15D9|nr:response regulator [uncultured Propionibacterium sp.]
MSDDASSDSADLRVIIYSDDRTVREQVRLALGRTVASDLPGLETSEFATQPALWAALDEQDYDVAVLDGEAVPAGGMGVAHQMKDEFAHPPLVVLLVAREADSWLAAWSDAEAISPYPVDPIRLPRTVADVVRKARADARMPMTPEVFGAPGRSSRHGLDDDHDVPKEMAVR